MQFSSSAGSTGSGTVTVIFQATDAGSGEWIRVAVRVESDKSMHDPETKEKAVNRLKEILRSASETVTV